MTTNTLSNVSPLFTELDVKAISISKPIPTNSGRGPMSYNMYISGPNRSPFSFQLTRPGPLHRSSLVFSPDPAQNGGDKTNITLSVKPTDEETINFWKSIDDLVIEHVSSNSKEFLKKQMTIEEVEAVFTRAVRQRPDYDPYIKARFHTCPDARTPFRCFEINEEKKRYAPLHHSRLAQSDVVVCVVQLGMIYSFNNKVGYTIDVSHLVRYTPAPCNPFPFRLGSPSEYTMCSSDTLWENVDKGLSEDQDQGQGHHDEDQDLVVVNAESEPEKKEDADLVLEKDSDDGSTVVIDPVTMKRKSVNSKPDGKTVKKARK